MDTQALVIDCRTRKLEVFVASATQAQTDNPYQLVLRHALDLGSILDLLAPTDQEARKKFLADMPVILMGEYQARSSAGHVTVHSADSWDEAHDGHRKVLIVGGLGEVFGGRGALRVLGNPIRATLVRGPVEVVELRGTKNSNRAQADAAWAGVKILSGVDRSSVFLVEGQSDHTYVVRFRSAGGPEAVVEFPAEHRAEMFSRENIVRRIIKSSAWHSIVCGRDDHGYTPSEEEVSQVARSILGTYLATTNYRGPLGLLNMSDDAIAKVAEELGVSTELPRIVASAP